MAAVRPIANAPQNVTRIVGFMMSAPPVQAPIMPSSARNTRDPMDTSGIVRFDGETSTSASGAAAPRENVAADANAACTGRAVLISDEPDEAAHVRLVIVGDWDKVKDQVTPFGDVTIYDAEGNIVNKPSTD